jgi:hypothetical protein
MYVWGTTGATNTHREDTMNTNDDTTAVYYDEVYNSICCPACAAENPGVRPTTEHEIRALWHAEGKGVLLRCGGCDAILMTR